MEAVVIIVPEKSNSLTQILSWPHDWQALPCDSASHPLPSTYMAPTKSDSSIDMYLHMCTWLYMRVYTCMQNRTICTHMHMHGHTYTFTYFSSVRVFTMKGSLNSCPKVLKILLVLPTLKSLLSFLNEICPFVLLVPALGCLFLSFSPAEEWKLSVSHQERNKGPQFLKSHLRQWSNDL